MEDSARYTAMQVKGTIDGVSVRSVVKSLANVILITYLIYRAVMTFMIMPLVVLPWSFGGAYFVAVFLLALGIAVWSFRSKTPLVLMVAGLFTGMAFFYWWVVICRRGAPIWSDFGWLVVPEICFSLAVVVKWFVSVAGRPNEKFGDNGSIPDRAS